MSFIFTNVPNTFQGRRARLETYLNTLSQATQEQMATNAGITFTPSSDIDVATEEDYTLLAVSADAATYFDYSAVTADIRDKYEELAIADLLPEDKAALAAASSVSGEPGPVFSTDSEVHYLTVMLANYPDWAKLVYENTVTAGDRDPQLEDFIMKMSGSAKNEFAKAVPTASYASDIATGLFSIDGDGEYDGIIRQAYALIKKKK